MCLRAQIKGHVGLVTGAVFGYRVFFLFPVERRSREEDGDPIYYPKLKPTLLGFWEEARSDHLLVWACLGSLWIPLF